ncbi:MAG: hypothetical protein H6821_17380, partial [Planctomycetaceae bacterium]|nr:hypothetical protein [Planctomycetaceae bacterium]
NDNVVLAYRGDKGIYLATSAENAWHSSLIVETDNSPTFNPDALKFDEEGYAHFIYRREIDEIEQIVYGTNRSGMWRFETLPTNADEDINSVVFDVGASGEIFIAYGNYQNIHLFQKMGMEWVSEIIAENVKFCRSLALTETGDPAIVYTNDGVFFAERRHGEWKISPVDESDNVAVGSLKILSPDLVYIAYWDTDEQQLRFATRDADTWVIENIQETKGTAREAVMDVDDQGIPHIYYSSTNPNFRPQVIRYATKQDGQWYVDNDENAAIDLDGVRLGFAIDREGTHHVIYTSRFGILLLDTDPPKLAN